ncbi:hypothetical protein MSAS_13480 [Mycobacterium saskatchewanense]|uniref:Uncharacterized protein n=1 Tax=Mycobacterium saskatchewanense TaxID=220927 RepID=A0AAJ3NK85_9MYCO|nr:hypothetical protein [Mycobacterium saskatchewanense]ORW64132.1 hypothetical protein AWC23_26150 [Mycobacterium saskatchewanense]BBX62174.1 hypothetical protein MSAS_13480 [Mycobacterium saskatchewanense]
MNGAMMGFLGMVFGASAVGVAGVARSVVDTVLPRMMDGANHKSQMSINLQAQRHEAIQRWRAGLAGARDDYRRWAAGPRDVDAPNVVGDEWFEGLRPHLPTTGEAAKYRSACEIHCDNTTTMQLSLEIGRIEREWTDEAMGAGRRNRRG